MVQFQKSQPDLVARAHLQVIFHLLSLSHLYFRIAANFFLFLVHFSLLILRFLFMLRDLQYSAKKNIHSDASAHILFCFILLLMPMESDENIRYFSEYFSSILCSLKSH